VQFSDGVNVSSETLSPELQSIFDQASCPKQAFVAEELQVKVLSEFFDKIIDESTTH
jgi:hypothetical protein